MVYALMVQIHRNFLHPQNGPTFKKREIDSVL